GSTLHHAQRLRGALLFRAQPAAGADGPAGAVAWQGLQAAALVGGEPAGDTLGTDPEDGRDGVGGEAGLAGGDRPQTEGGTDLIAQRTRIEQGHSHDSTSVRRSPFSSCQDTTAPDSYQSRIPLYLVAGVISRFSPVASSGDNIASLIKPVIRSPVKYKASVFHPPFGLR